MIILAFWSILVLINIDNLEKYMYTPKSIYLKKKIGNTEKYIRTKLIEN